MELPLDLKLELKDLLADEYQNLRRLGGNFPHSGLRFHQSKCTNDIIKIMECEEAVPWSPFGYYCTMEKPAYHPFLPWWCFFIFKSPAPWHRQKCFVLDRGLGIRFMRLPAVKSTRPGRIFARERSFGGE